MDTPPCVFRKQPDGIKSPDKFCLSGEHVEVSNLRDIPFGRNLHTKRYVRTRGTASKTAVDESTITEIWQQVDTLQNCMAFHPNEDNCDTDSDPEDYSQKRTGSVMAFLPCGNIHVCSRGKFCPYLEETDDHLLVCAYTGVEHAPEHTSEFFDLNGGTGKKSGDPDQHCGELLHGKWTKRVDQFSASRKAFHASAYMDDDDFKFVASEAEGVHVARPAKRGALCVGESENAVSSKRLKCSKKNVQCQQTRSQLHAEAESIITKMVDHKKATCFNKKAPEGSVQRRCIPVDPLMKDEHYVFLKFVKKYIKQCIVLGQPANYNEIHNLGMMARSASTKAREQERQQTSIEDIRTAKFRTLCSSLIVSLWSAACCTPYMANARRGTDAYRPFVCGVLYAFKRGVSLENGVVLVPRCPPLADALPVLRGTGGNNLARTLHSSSHRGLCTLTRCIASVPKEDQAKTFQDVARIAQHFRQAIFSKLDV